MRHETLKKIKNNSQKGQALLAGLLLFAAGTSVLLSGLGYAQTKDVGDVRASSASKQSFFSSESALEDSVYRLKTSKTIGSTDQVSIAGSQGTASVTTTSGGKQIASVGANNNYDRDTAVTLSTGQGVAFNYGMQAGTGGLSLTGGSGVYGNIYANGPITSDWSGFITGTAVAANTVPITSDQSNTTPLPPTQNVTFATTSSKQDFAQSFITSTTSPITKVSLYMEKVGSPSDLTVRIVTDNSGSPSTTQLTSGTLSASTVTTSYGWVDVLFSSNPTLTAGTTYWIVIDGSPNSSNYYTIAANTSYSSGTGKVGQYSGTWINTSPSGLDGYFDVYLGGAPVSITGPGQNSFDIGQSGVGDAYADNIVGVNVAGNLYCQTGSLNNTSCNTSRADPVSQNFPVSSANITDWESAGTAGGVISGNETVGPYPNQDVTLGPKEINGNLTVNSGGTLTLSGTLYVTGNVDITGGSTVNLSSSYGSGDGLIVANGTITIDSGSNATGSGTSGSYIMLLTTSSSNNAISLSGGSGAVILNAQSGTVNITGGTNANQVSAYQINVSGGSSITYQSGLANTNFSSGPSGGYSVSSWEETP